MLLVFFVGAWVWVFVVWFGGFFLLLVGCCFFWVWVRCWLVFCVVFLACRCGVFSVCLSYVYGIVWLGCVAQPCVFKTLSLFNMNRSFFFCFFSLFYSFGVCLFFRCLCFSDFALAPLSPPLVVSLSLTPPPPMPPPPCFTPPSPSFKSDAFLSFYALLRNCMLLLQGFADYIPVFAVNSSILFFMGISFLLKE